MSSDFLGIMLCGPEHIDPAVRDQAIQGATDMVEDAIANDVIGQELETILIQERLNDDETEITRSTIEPLVNASVDAFIETWNEGSDIGMDRVITVGGKSRKVVCIAGESHSGETPSRDFDVFERAIGLNVAYALGCH